MIFTRCLRELDFFLIKTSGKTYIRLLKVAQQKKFIETKGFY